MTLAEQFARMTPELRMAAQNAVAALANSGTREIRRYQMHRANYAFYLSRPSPVQAAMRRYPMEMLYTAQDGAKLALRSLYDAGDDEPTMCTARFIWDDGKISPPVTLCLAHLTLIPDSHAEWVERYERENGVGSYDGIEVEL